MKNSDQNGFTDAVNNRCLIGIDLGATNVRVARIFEDDIEQIESEGIVDSDKPSDLLDQIGRLIQKVDNDAVESIGMGVPSVVDVEAGIVYDVQNIPGWKKVPVKSILEEQFNKPVHLNNDANCFALGEKYFGKGRGYDSVVGLTLGSGFGSGLILNGRLYYGAHCGAGEVGMFPYKETIMEHYCSGMLFEREYGVSGKEVFKKAKKGDEEALNMYKVFGTHLGTGIKTVLYAYDPEIIILGGSIRTAWPFFKKAMHEAIEDFGFPSSLKSLRIEVSELEDVAVLGAAALSLDVELAK